MAGTLTVDQAVSQLEAAIDHGEAMSQHAPGGHPLFAALDQARQVLSWLEENGPAAAPVFAPGTRIYESVTAALYDILEAEGTMRVPADATFDWSKPLGVPWAWIGGGVAAIALGYFLWRRHA